MTPNSLLIIFTVWSATLACASGFPGPSFSVIDDPASGEAHPFMEDRGDLQATLGQPVLWPLADPPVGDRTYSVSGLPPGLRIDAKTGEISGRPKLTGRSRVVIGARLQHPTDPVAILAFNLEVFAPDLAEEDSQRPEDMPITLGRLPLTPGVSSVEPAIALTEGSVSLVDPLPAGVSWSSSTQATIGLPLSPGTFPIRYRSPGIPGDGEGLLVIRAGDDAVARLLASGGDTVAFGGDSLMSATGRAVSQVDIANAPSMGALPVSESTGPWSSLFGGRIFSLDRGAGKWIAVAQNHNLYVSPDGVTWSSGIFESHIFRVFASDGSVLVSGDGWSAISVDGEDWTTIPADQLGQIAAACHNGREWIAIAATGAIKKSIGNAQTWTELGRLNLEMGSSALQLAFHKETYHLSLADVSTNPVRPPNTYLSDDAVEWRASDSPGHVIKFAKAGDRLWALTRESLYQSNDEGLLQLRWMAPAGMRLTDLAAASDGRVAVASAEAAWVLDGNRLPPQLQGPLEFPGVQHRAATVGVPFSFFLASDPPATEFKSYHLPEGVTLDPVSGVLSGVLPEIGRHTATVSVANANGEGIPRLFHIDVDDGRRPGNPGDDVVFPDDETEGFSAWRQGETIPPITVGTRLSPRETVMASARQLPPGLKFDATSWKITGAVTEVGLFPIVIDLVSPRGRETLRRTYVSYRSEAGQIDSPGHTAFEVDTPVEISYRAIGHGETAVYFALGLPAGLHIDAATGVVMGRVSMPGTYTYLVGFENPQGDVGQPYFETAYVEPAPWPLAPSTATMWIHVADPEAAAWPIESSSLSEGGVVEFLSLPQGISFVPPRTLVPEPGLAHGLYTARVRESNLSGFAEKDAIIIVYRQREEWQPFQLLADAGSPHHAVVGNLFRARFEGLENADRLMVAGLPRGLHFDEATRTISGIPEEVTQFGNFVFMATRNGVAIARSDLSIEVVAPSFSAPPRGMYPTALATFPLIGEAPSLDPVISSLLAPDRLPDGVEYSHGFYGTTSVTGRHETTMRYLADPDRPGFPVVLTVYDPPAWEPERRRARHLPVNPFLGPTRVAVPERQSAFSPEPRLLATADDTTWVPLRPPVHSGTQTYTDIASGRELILAGGDWWAQARHRSRFPSATPSNEGILGLAARRDLVVSATRSGVQQLREGLWLPFGSSPNRYESVAIGGDRVVGVGQNGMVAVLTVSGERVSDRPRVAADLTEVIYSEGEFIAVGNHGTVIRSTDTVNWSVERAPQLLGADLRSVTANRDWIVAFGPWVTLGKRRAGDGPWEPLERIAVPGSYLDRLATANGARVGGFAEGLYVPRRASASATVLGSSYQQALSGEEFQYDIVALAGDPVGYRVEGLPPGLTFDAARGRITGKLSEPAIHEILIEASSGGHTHGRTLAVEVFETPPRLSETFVETTIGSGPFQLPVTARLLDGSREIQVESRPIGVHQIPFTLVNAAGTTRQVLTLHVVEPKPVFRRQPEPLTMVREGDRVELEVEIQGQWPIAMQWYRNGELVPGETNQKLTIDPLTEAKTGTYELRTSNALGNAVSEPALVVLESISEITYASWAAGLGLAADSHFEDRDGNGQSNILEYALGESPTGEWPRFDRSTDGGRLEYILTHPPDRADTAWELQWSEDLQTWESIPFEALAAEPVDDDVNNERLRWRLPSLATGYVRFKASLR